MTQAGVVLVVEDDAAIRALLRELLETYGYTAVEARDAPAGLERAQGAVPDAVLLDLGLPGIGGVDVLEVLSGDPALRDVPVIVVTGETDPDVLARARDLGAYACLPKPFDASELLAWVGAAVRERRGEGPAEVAAAGDEDRRTVLRELARRIERAARDAVPLALLALRVADVQAGEARARERLRGADFVGACDGGTLVVIAQETDGAGAATLADALEDVMDRGGAEIAWRSWAGEPGEELLDRCLADLSDPDANGAGHNGDEPARRSTARRP